MSSSVPPHQHCLENSWPYIWGQGEWQAEMWKFAKIGSKRHFSSLLRLAASFLAAVPNLSLDSAATSWPSPTVAS